MESHRLAIQLPGNGMKFLRFPLTRFFLAIIYFIVSLMIARVLGKWISDDLLSPDLHKVGTAIRFVLYCGFALGGYALYCATIEGRRVHELNLRKSIGQTALGLLLGMGFISIIVLIMWVTGCYKVTGMNSVMIMLPLLAGALQTGITEEILSRGIIFRIAEDGVGTWWSVLISAAFFGFGHIWNPNATVISSVSIALTAGIILAMLYVITRQLWIPIGLHMGWNFALGGIYGAPVSGLDMNGFLIPSISGPEWLTGGAFGPEASIITVLVFMIFGAFLIRKSIRENSWIKPMWRS